MPEGTEEAGQEQGEESAIPTYIPASHRLIATPTEARSLSLRESWNRLFSMQTSTTVSWFRIVFLFIKEAVLKFSLQGSSQKKIKRGRGLISKHICGFYDHIKYILPQKGGLPPLWLDPCIVH